MYTRRKDYRKVLCRITKWGGTNERQGKSRLFPISGKRLRSLRKRYIKSRLLLLNGGCISDHPDSQIIIIALPNYLHEAAVMLCVKHKRNPLPAPNHLGRTAAEAFRIDGGLLRKPSSFSRLFRRIFATRQSFKKSSKFIRMVLLGSRSFWAKSRETHPGPHADWVLGFGRPLGVLLL